MRDTMKQLEHEFSTMNCICRNCRLMAQDDHEYRSPCPAKLSDLMGFDHVIRVGEDGTVTELRDVYAPDYSDDVVESDDWATFSDGYSGQDRYSGPTMHDSEFIGGALARDILNNEGTYVAVVNYFTDDDGETDIEGWAVLRLKD